VKPKIAILGSRGYPYVYSGYETFIKETAERLSDKYEIHVYCHRGLFHERPKEHNGIFLHYIPAIELKSLSQLSHSFLSTLHALFMGYAICFFVNPANGPFGYLLRLFGIKSLLNTDGVEWERPKWKGLGARYFYWAAKISTRAFDQLVADSEEMKAIYQREFNTSSEVIAYGAPVRSEADPEKIADFGITSQGYYLIVGRLIPDNNADLLIAGFLKSDSPHKLVVVGDVPYADAYADRVKGMANERLCFTGYVTDSEVLYQLYANCFCYLHGHEFGGTNPTLLKALGYRCAILALDTPFSREVLNEEQHGLYFERKEESVTQMIQFVEKNPAVIIEQRKTAHARILEKYTWERIADQYDVLFQQLLNR